MPRPDSIPAKNAAAAAVKTLPSGIAPIVQTPFRDSRAVDVRSFERLIEDAIAAGAAGGFDRRAAKNARVNYTRPTRNREIHIDSWLSLAVRPDSSTSKLVGV